MQAARQSDYVSVDNCLAAEQTSEIRHEYLGGFEVLSPSTERAEKVVGPDARLALASLQLVLALAAVYEGI